MTNIEKEVKKKISVEAQKQKKGMEEDHSRFFIRPEYPRYVADCLSAVSTMNDNDIRMSVKINPRKDSDYVAYTDGKRITLYPLDKFFNGLTLADHAEVVLGIAAHELSHIIYTGFPEFRKACEAMEAGKIIYLPKSKARIVTENLKKMEAALLDTKDSTGKNVIIEMFHQFHNILEDGYIEDHFLNEYNGELADALCLAREFQFYNFPSLVKNREETEGSPLWDKYHLLFLSYAKYGTFVCDNLGELHCEEIDYMEKLFPTIDAYMAMPHGHQPQKMALVIELMCRAWDIIEDYIHAAQTQKELLKALKEMMKRSGMSGLTSEMPSGSIPLIDLGDDDEEESDGDGESSGNSSSKSSSSSKSGRSKAAEKTKKSIEKAKNGESGEDSDNSENGKDSKSGKGSKEGKAEGSDEDSSSKDGKKGKDGKEGEKDGDGSDTGSKDGNTESEEDGGDEVPERVTPPPCDEAKAASDSTNVGHKVITNVIEEEAERIDNSASGEVRDSGKGSFTKEIISDSGYERSASDIDTLINTIARERAAVALETAAAKEMSRKASHTRLTGMHEGCDIFLERIGDVTEEMKERYNQIAPPLLQVSKQLQKSVAKKLKEVKSGSKQTNLLVGKKLMTNSLYRVDGRIFSSTRLPRTSKLAVALLLDESGSMSGCHRITSARATAIIIEDFCRGLGIPCCIYGHSADQHRNCENSVEIYSYVSFDSIDGNDKYRLMDISARCGNRDGAALMFVGNEMLKRTEENRIIILVSDGQPAANGYYGKETEDDLRTIKKQLNRAGIPLFAAAIGSDKENIHRIYGDGFFDISDLNEMPKILTKLIQKFCRI